MLNSFHLYMTGILINLQFYTSIPIRKDFPMDKRQLTYVLQTFPVLGLTQGVIYAGFLYLLQTYTPFSDLMLALFLWLLMIILSGGIHLDGWIDTSDAYFSFKDPEKRLEILQDPRVGAFGVLSVVVFLIIRLLILYEIIQLAGGSGYLFIILIPFLGKSLLGIFLQTMHPARKEGMASFFQQGKTKYVWLIYSFYFLLAGFVVGWLQWESFHVYLIFLIVFIMAAFILARSIKKNFTGITGDTLGAGSEGMELLLWMTLWLLHSFAMV